MSRCPRLAPDALRVQVPASTSNLGPGFDLLGLALSLRLEVVLSRASRSSTGHELLRSGSTSSELPEPSSDVLLLAFQRGAERLEVNGNFRFEVHTEIPIGRGFGSTGAAVAAGMLLANAVAESEASLDELLAWGIELEGHPDNVTASLFGGCTLCHPDPASEGPVWIADGEYVLFSEIPRNRITKWKEGEGKSIYMEPSGYTGKEPFGGEEPGTNGLLLDHDKRLIMCCHGDRQVKRIEKDGSVTILASEYEGKRLNSPNDAVVHSSGAIYFTDPPYGLPGGWNSEARELDYCGVYRRATDGSLTLLTKEMTRPNGIALSPDDGHGPL